MLTRILLIYIIFSLTGTSYAQRAVQETRPRLRDIGLKIGILPTGSLNAITDVSGVTVGHTTIIRGDNIRTGVTAIVPHAGNLFAEKVPGACSSVMVLESWRVRRR